MPHVQIARAALVAWTLGSAAAWAAERPAVVYVTQDAAFVNRGAVEGVVTGAVLMLTAPNGAALPCRVTAVSDHAASCSAERVKVGDSIASPLAAPVRAGVVGARPRVAAPTAVSPGALEGAFAKVEFHTTPAVRRSRRTLATATLSHETWTADYSQSTYNLERLDLALYGLPVGFAGLRASAAASLLVWSNRTSAARYQSGSSFLALVQQAQVDRRAPDEALGFAAGRIQPAHVPGLWILDGVQGSWRSKTGDEVGVYGGAVPDLVTLAPDLSTWSAGAYYAHGLSSGRAFQLWDEGRIGIAQPVAGPARAEAEERLNARLGDVVSFGGDVRAALPFDGSGTPQLDSATANLSAHFGATWMASASYRYLSSNSPDARVLLTTPLGVGAYGSQHADAMVNWDVLRGLNVGLHGGLSDDLGGGTGLRTFAGPTVALPLLWDRKLGLAIGYDQYFNDFHGLTTYVQASLAATPRLRLMARASFTNDFLGPGTGALQDIGGYARAEYDIASFLSVRASALVLYGVNLGVDANLSFVGRL